MHRAKGLVRLLGPLFLASASGCYGPHLIQETPDGGVVALPNNTNQWPTYYRNRAEFLMQKKCPEGYVIDREEATKDNPTTRDGRKPNEDFEYNGAYHRISNDAIQQYRITFHCAAASKNLPPPSPPPKTKEEKDELPPPRRVKSPTQSP